MFSFILKLQSFFERFQKNKWLFFTAMTTVAIIVITVSMMYLSTVGYRTARGVFLTEKERFLSTVEQKLVSKAEQLLSNAEIIRTNDSLSKLIIEGEAGPLKEKFSSLAGAINQLSASKYQMALYGMNLVPLFDTQATQLPEEPTQRSSILLASSTLKPIVGVERLGGELWIRSITPFLNDNKEPIAILELRQSIDLIQEALIEEKRKFLFVLNKDFMDKKEFETLKYLEINTQYVTLQKSIDRGFFDFLTKINFSQLKSDGFVVDHDYYVTYRIVDDVEGNPFGMFLTGEDLRDSGSIVATLDKVSKTITIVALGLVVALLILMI